MTMQESLKDFIQLIKEAKKICESQLYCSEECLYKHYTPEERTELYNY
jgi:hypothetical protein